MQDGGILSEDRLRSPDPSFDDSARNGSQFGSVAHPDERDLEHFKAFVYRVKEKARQIAEEEVLLRAREEVMTRYLLMKVEERDWHGVQDAASDLRDIESKRKGLRIGQPQGR